jgi:hypothetical protein
MKRVSIKKILSFDVNIIFEKDLIGGDSVGKCFSDQCKILIFNELPEQVKYETILHEQLHFISDKLNLNLSEKQVQGITIGLLSIIKDNNNLL